MKFRPIRKWTPVVVKWVDAFTTFGSVSSSDYVENYDPMIRRTSGHYLATTENGVFVTETDDRSKPSSVDCDNVTCIPLGMVLEIEIPNHCSHGSGTPKPRQRSKQLRRNPRKR